MNSKKDISIEYAHIYTNDKIGEEHRFSLEVLQNEYPIESRDKRVLSLSVMIDDYSFPDPNFDEEKFFAWLAENGHRPDVMIRESELIPVCDEVLRRIQNKKLKDEIVDYINKKKYPCSLFIASWYLVRLGYLGSPVFDEQFTAERLLNILPFSFKPFEEKAFEIIFATIFSDAAKKIKNKYFEGRQII